VIVMPWPPKELSPNWRGHWARKAKAAKLYRMACRLAVLKSLSQDQVQQARQWGQLELSLNFYPRDRRKRDDDNLIASFKSGRDGIADALGVDDANFLTTARLMPFDSEHKATVIATINERHDK